MNPAALVFAIRSTRRVRTEQEPRDHYDRWVHGHRRSARDSKPRLLKNLWTTGDSDVPRKFIGRVIGLEAWGSYYIIFLKSRRWSWSIPYIIHRSLCSDVNRRNIWIQARGVSSNGPIRIPVPLGGGDQETHMLEHIMGFRTSFEAQINSDIQEDMAWGIGSGMMPPSRERVREAQVQQPALTDREFMSEEAATGGSK